MNRIAKRVLIGLVVVVVLGSVAANAYYFGFLTLRNYYITKGFNAAAAQVYNSVKKNGLVKVGDITLIQQRSTPDVQVNK